MKGRKISGGGVGCAVPVQPLAVVVAAGAGLLALGGSVGCSPGGDGPGAASAGGAAGGAAGQGFLVAAADGSPAGAGTPVPGGAGGVLGAAVEDAYAAAVAGAEVDSYLMEATGVEFVPMDPVKFARVVGALREWAMEEPRGVARWLAGNSDPEVVDRLVGEVVWAVSDGGAAAGRDGAPAAERLIDAIDDTDQWTVAVWAYTRRLAESYPAEEAVERLARLERIDAGRALQMVGIENSRIDAGIVPEHAVR